jgi:HSP20 family protein
MLIRNADPFREFDRLTQQLMGTTNRPVVMPNSVDLDVERNVLTIRAERVAQNNGDWQMLASERPRGAFSRQLVLGDNLDLEHIDASYRDGVLRLVVPVAEKAKPRKIELKTDSESRTAIEA